MAETKNTNSNTVVILVILVVVLAVVMFFFARQSCSTGKDMALIKETLNTQLASIKKDIADSKTRENALLQGQRLFNIALYGDEKEEGVLNKLDKSWKDINDIQDKFSKRPEPVDVETLKTLDQCKAKYTEVKETLSICTELNNSKDSALVLFGKVKENLLSQVSLLNGAISELKSQVGNFRKIEKKVIKSMETLDKAYRNKRFWGTVKNVGIGSAAGVLAVIVLKMIK